MATIKKIGVSVETRVELTINEDELRALDALFGYGVDSFLKVFYEHLGRAYLSPHEAGLRSLFTTIGRCNGLAEEANECRLFLKQAANERIKKELARA